MKIPGDVGEYEIHRLLRGFVHGLQPPMGPGDDASVIKLSEDLAVVWCTDIVPSGLRGEQAGRFAVLQNCSDIIAMGGVPVGFLLAVAMPKELLVTEFGNIMRGAANEAEKYNSYILGGDIKERDFFSVTGSGLGRINPDRILCRKGARPGDLIGVTLTNNRGLGRRWAWRVSSFVFGPDHKYSAQLERFYKIDTELPIRVMTTIVSLGVATASIDMSDGLSGSAELLAKASNVVLVIDYASLTEIIASEAAELAKELAIPPSAFAFTPGYEWECLVVFDSKQGPRLQEMVRTVGSRLVTIGKVEEGPAEALIEVDGERLPLPRIGDEKFSNVEQYNSPSSWLSFVRDCRSIFK